MADVTKELGNPGGIGVDPSNWMRPTPTSFIIDPLDPNADLRFPSSIPIYDDMRKTEGQISSLLRACSLPIISARWNLNNDGVKSDVVDFVRAQLGLGLTGTARQRRRRQGIVWTDHLREALLCLPLGFMPFEQVYAPGPPAKPIRDLDVVLHLRKLAPRLPRTVTQIHVARDGGLAGISQAPLSPNGFGTMAQDVFIPVDRLVFYVLDKEGADWSGTPILRTAYKHWLINDTLTRMSAQIVERNGMGVPKITYDPSVMSKEDADKIGSDFRIGATASLSLPIGSTAELMGVSGSTYDPLPLMKHHEQAMSKAALAMFLDLGHDAGARSLGDTFLDVFTSSLQAIADAIASTATEHIIRDLVELNFGPDEPYPVLTAGDLSANKGITTTAMKELVDAGIIKADDDLEAYTRERHGLPAADPNTAREKAASPAPAPAEPAPAAFSENTHDAEVKAMLRRIIELREASQPGTGHV